MMAEPVSRGTLTEADIHRVARLARLRISDDAAAGLQKDLGRVLAHVALLGELELDHVEPLASPSEQCCRLRPDVASKPERETAVGEQPPAAERRLTNEDAGSERRPTNEDAGSERRPTNEDIGSESRPTNEDIGSESRPTKADAGSESRSTMLNHAAFRQMAPRLDGPYLAVPKVLEQDSGS